MTSKYELDVDLALFANKYDKLSMKKGGRFLNKKIRTCHSFNGPGHCSNKCLCEKREDKPKYEKVARKNEAQSSE
jgi:hypothetical protein